MTPPTPLLSLAPCPPALQTLFRLQKVKESSWFWAPVKAEEAPGYFDVVRRPMDLATISDKVRAMPWRAGVGQQPLVWQQARDTEATAML